MNGGVNLLSSRDYEKTLQFITSIRPDTGHFRKTVLSQLQSMYGYNHSTFFVTDSAGNLGDPVASNISGYFNEIYVQYFYKVDMFHVCNISGSLLRKKLVSVTDIMSYDQYANTEYYNDFIKKINLHYEVILPLRIDDKLLGVIGVFKSKDEGGFTKKDSQILNRINEHIAYNLKTSKYINQIQNEQHMLRCCCLQSPAGILVLNQDFSLLYYNEPASQYCSDIAVSKSVPGAMSEVLNAVIEKIVGRLFNAPIAFRSYQVRVIPQIIPGLSGGLETVYIIYISKTSPPNDQVIEKAAALYLLSSREKEILGLICSGLSNQDIAEKSYISIHTVKSHIENIFKKMGINKRASLFSIIDEIRVTI